MSTNIVRSDDVETQVFDWGMLKWLSTPDVTGGDMVFIPEGVEHGTWNTGWETLVLLAVYAPPGPEAVLADPPECEIVPPGELPGADATGGD